MQQRSLNKRHRFGRNCLTDVPPTGSQSRHTLASVAYVQRSISTIASLPHELLASYLDWSHLWTLESATKAGLIHVLNRLREREFPRLDPRIRRARYVNGTRLAIEIKNACLYVFKWWLECYEPSLASLIEPRTIEDAVKCGHLDVLRWLHGRKPHSGELLCSGQPIECHHEAVARWVHANHIPLLLKLSIDAAASVPNLRYVQWIQDHEGSFKVECTREALSCAARSGDLAMADWLRVNRPLCWSESAIAAAAEGGHLSMVQWLYETYQAVSFVVPSSSISSADIVRWVVTNFSWQSAIERLLWIYEATTNAACRGDANLTKELYSTFKRLGGGEEAHIRQRLLANDITIGKFAIDYAADGGHLEILIWLWEKGSTECSTDAMDAAAINGHLDVLKWLHSHTTTGCTHQAMDGAATIGNFEVLKWLHFNRLEGCTTEAMDFAAGNGFLEIVQWLHENRTEGCTVTAMDTAGEEGHLDVIQWLHANRSEGCSPDAIVEASRRGNLEVVRWLCERYPEQCTSNVADAAAYKGHISVLAFLISQCQIHCTAQGVQKAAESCQFAVLEWLLQYEPQDAYLDAMLRGISLFPA